MNSSKSFVIGLSGATCGGKSTLTELLRQTFGNHVKTYNQDDYYFDEDYKGHVFLPELNHINWELESAFNNIRLFENIVESDKKFDQGTTSAKIIPQDCVKAFDQASQNWPSEQFLLDNKEISSRTKELFKHWPAIPIQIVEGITIFNSKQVSDVCDLKIFLTLDHQTCSARRSKRAYDPPDPPGYFEKIVWPSYVDQLKQIKADPSIHFVDGAQPMPLTFLNSMKLVLKSVNNVK